MNEPVQEQHHWIRGPSGAPRIMKCPGCVEEQQGYPEDPSRATSIDGTHSHTLFETCLHGRNIDARGYLGQTLTDHEGDFVVKQDRVGRVNLALDYVWDRFRILDNPSLYSECIVDPGKLRGIPDWKGTADVILADRHTLEVIDYKDGWVVIQPDSPQLTSYAMGADDSWPLIKFKTIRQTIIQPKDTKNPIKSIEYRS